MSGVWVNADTYGSESPDEFTNLHHYRESDLTQDQLAELERLKVDAKGTE